MSRWVARVMDVVLHLGAHRTGTTSFQDYMRRHLAPLEAQGVAFWGPRRRLEGLHETILFSDAARRRAAATRIQAKLAQVADRGMQTLVVSDQEMMGTVADNVDAAQFYPEAGARVAAFSAAFGGQVTTVMLSPRSLDGYWASALAALVFSGHSIPCRETLHQIVLARRGWRDVIRDIAAALPGADIRILPFETYAGRPDALLSAGLDCAAPFDRARGWLNRAPTLPDLRRALADKPRPGPRLPFGMGRWNPFTTDEYAALRELHADDMMWLTAGADGLATLTEDRRKDRAGPTPSLASLKKGRSDEHEERQMARPG